MVRFLLFSNEFDVEGIVASAGTNTFTADKTRILEVLDYYDQVDENLRKHDAKYPTADYLRSVTYQGLGNEGPISIQWHCDNGQWENIIGEGRDCEASEAIIAAADKDDPRPIYIGVWGGPRDVAQAIWKVKNTRSQAEFEAFQSKLRIFLIHCQDATNQYLIENFPDLFIVWSRTTYLGMFGVHNREWVLTNIKNNHGPLCALYPDYNYKGEPAGVVEGDSPSFMWLLSANRGINNPDDPTQPSWGGQYQNIPGTNHYGGPEYEGPMSSISMWSNDFDAEFAERADWCLDEEVIIEDDEADVWLEAECGSIGDLWDITSDASASNAKFISIKSGNNSTANAPAANGLATYDFNISENGTYTLWARVIAPSANDDSFWLKMDSGAWFAWNNIASSGNWAWVSSQSYSLVTGTHTLTIGYREDGSKLDKFYLTKTSVTPIGEGGSAANCSGSVGLNSLPGDKQILVYPNPTDDFLQVYVPANKIIEGELAIYDLYGKLIKYYGELQNENQIDISELIPGQYFLSVGNRCNQVFEKFIIK